MRISGKWDRESELVHRGKYKESKPLKSSFFNIQVIFCTFFVIECYIEFIHFCSPRLSVWQLRFKMFRVILFQWKCFFLLSFFCPMTFHPEHFASSKLWCCQSNEIEWLSEWVSEWLWVCILAWNAFTVSMALRNFIVRISCSHGRMSK